MPYEYQSLSRPEPDGDETQLLAKMSLNDIISPQESSSMGKGARILLFIEVLNAAWAQRMTQVLSLHQLIPRGQKTRTPAKTQENQKFMYFPPPKLLRKRTEDLRVSAMYQ